MDNKEAVEALKIHKRWINGKGKKYMPTDLPVGIVQVSAAIDLACNHFKHRICPSEFMALVRMAERGGAKEEIDFEALKSARKVVRYLKKKGL